MSTETRILIVESGPEGSARNLVDAISKRHPDWDLHVTNNKHLQGVIGKLDWTALVVDVPASGDKMVEAADSATRFDCMRSWNTGYPTIVAVDDKELLMESPNEDTRELRLQSFQICGRSPRSVLSWLEVMASPRYQKVQQRYKEA